MAKQFYSVRDIVLATGLSRDTIYRRVNEGVLPAVKLGGKKLLIPAAAFDQILKLGAPDRSSYDGPVRAAQAAG